MQNVWLKNFNRVADDAIKTAIIIKTRHCCLIRTLNDKNDTLFPAI